MRQRHDGSPSLKIWRALARASDPWMRCPADHHQTYLIAPFLNRASVPLVRPLILHQAILQQTTDALGLGASEVQRELRAAADRWARRQYRLDEILLAAETHHLAPPVLVQGTALAFLYPSPALRTSADLDLLVRSGDRPRWQALLRSLGWCATKGNWVHRDGTNLDLHTPATDLGERLYLEAHALSGRSARTPSLPLQLVLIARHSARHQADRLWRDVADVRVLLEASGDPGALLTEAAAACPPDTRGAFAGLLRFVHRCAMPSFWNPPAGGARFLKLCATQALAESGAAEADLLEPILFPLQRTKLNAHQRTATPQSMPGRLVRVDEQLGALPPVGVRLWLLRLRLLGGQFRRGTVAALIRRVRLRRRIRLGNSDFL